MKLKYKQVLEMYMALADLGQMKFPLKTCIKIAQLSNKINMEVVDYSEKRDELLKEYHVKMGFADDKLSFECLFEESNEKKQDNLEKFSKELDKLLNEEANDIEIEVIQIPSASLNGNLFMVKKFKTLADFIEVV